MTTCNVWGRRGAVILAATLAGCAGRPAGSGETGPEAGARSVPEGGADGAPTSMACAVGRPLAGASYEIDKSKFAFGSKPVEQAAGSWVRWMGKDGTVSITGQGVEQGEMNAGAPETNRPDWSKSLAALDAHVQSYFESMGVASCEVMGFSASFASGGSKTPKMLRGVGGIAVDESLAYARFDVDDQTTLEALYWPEIPASVVSDARAFQAKLGSPAGLAAYKAKLPSDARGDGHVVIHHTSSLSPTPTPFRAEATYDVALANPGDSSGFLSFDVNGKPVKTIW